MSFSQCRKATHDWRRSNVGHRDERLAATLAYKTQITKTKVVKLDFRIIVISLYNSQMNELIGAMSNFYQNLGF